MHTKIIAGDPHANPWGLHDMAGNVWEWTASPWTDSHAADTKVNESYRVVRGGCWDFIPEALRSAYRFWYYPDVADNEVGFRLARTCPSDLSLLTLFRDGETGPEMVTLPGGRFLMGSPETRPRRYSDERPQREMEVSAFAMGRNPVTVAEYRAFCEATDREMPVLPAGFGGDRQPMVRVTAQDAEAYCAWLSQGTGAEYRLPTEVEWECACRAGTTTAFWWGSDPAGAADHAWCEESAGGRTRDVAQPAAPERLLTLERGKR
jgi:formylglycine-generating enzyme required for sulfatase activity